MCELGVSCCNLRAIDMCESGASHAASVGVLIISALRYVSYYDMDKQTIIIMKYENKAYHM